MNKISRNSIDYSITKNPIMTMCKYGALVALQAESHHVKLSLRFNDKEHLKECILNMIKAFNEKCEKSKKIMLNENQTNQIPDKINIQNNMEKFNYPIYSTNIIYFSETNHPDIEINISKGFGYAHLLLTGSEGEAYLKFRDVNQLKQFILDSISAFNEKCKDKTNITIDEN